MTSFYGIHIEQPEGLVLDLMRLVLEPKYFRKSHITLRGPYNSSPKKTMHWLQEDVQGVFLGSAGRFISKSQSTVYFSCISDEVKKLSWKRDFPDAVSHITIYDGDDKYFADAIYKIASRIRLLVPLRTSKVIKLGKKITYESDLFFVLEKANYIYREIFGHDINYNQLNSMKKSELLDQFKALYCALEDLSKRYEDSYNTSAIA